MWLKAWHKPHLNDDIDTAGNMYEISKHRPRVNIFISVEIQLILYIRNTYIYVKHQDVDTEQSWEDICYGFLSDVIKADKIPILDIICVF